MTKPRVAVVGYGFAGRCFHTYLVDLAEGLELYALASSRPEARADADEDGRVSRAEFLDRETRMFDRLDADENGTITPEELDAAAERRQDRRFWWRD